MFRRWTGAALLCWTCLVNGAEVELRDEELLITAVRVDNNIVTEDLFLYYQPGYTLIPLQQFSDLVGFSIQVDVAGRSATGWFYEEDNTFNLNLNDNTLFIQGQPVALHDNLITGEDAFDLYINAPQLERWFGVELELVTSQLMLKVNSRRPLPITLKLRREKNRNIKERDDLDAEEPVDIKNHYRPWTYPVADVQTGVVVDELENSFYYSVEAAGDVLWHQTNLTLNGDQASDQRTARLLFSRSAPDRGEYMRLGLTEYNFGDVFTSGDTLINKGSSGMGVTFLRDGSGNWQSGFTEKLIEGDAPPGWEVELYRNGALIDFQVSDETGRYRFPNAPLQFGENVFDVKIYGPQGQRRQRRERVHVGADMIEPGQWRYHGSLMRENDSLFNNETTAPVKDNGELLARYGLSKRHSIGIGWSRSAFAINDEAHDYLKAGLYSAWPLLSTRWDIAKDVDGGTAHNIGLSTRLFDQEYTLEHAIYEDFFSQRNPNGNIVARTKLLWSGQYITGSGSSIPLILNIENTRTQEGGSRLVLRGLLTYSWNNFRFNSETNYFNGLQGEPRTGGGLNVNYIGDGWRFRSNTRYGIAPETELEQVTNTLDWEMGDWNYQAKLDVGLVEETPSTIGFNVTRRFRYGNFSFAVEASDDDRHEFRLGYDYSFGTRRRSPYVYGSTQRLADKGQVKARVFVDYNGNGIYDPDRDRPLGGVRFRGRNDWEETRTDADGQAILTGFNPLTISRLGVDETSFEDPFLKASQSELRIAHHGGGYYEVAFPVSAVSELEGYIYLQRQGEQTPASGLKLMLQNTAGDTVYETKSEFDGYYYFGDVIAGDYQLVLESRVQDSPSYRVNTPIDIEVNHDSAFIEVPTVVIEPR